MTNQPVNILVVDDRPEGIITMEAVLKDPAYQIVTASSGEEALGKLKEHEFAVILMDVQMPGMDGIQTVRRIKEHEPSRYVPIIFITAIDKDVRHILEGYSVGAVDYLLKPFSPEILRSKVRVFADLYLMQHKVQFQASLLEKQSNELQELNDSLKIAQKEIVEISEKERNRLGSDLHDSLAQELAAGCFMVGAIKNRWGETIPEKVGSVFNDLFELLQRSQNHTRRLARTLYPVELERGGLAMALRDLAMNTSKLFNINCEVSVDGPEFQAEDELVKTQFYRIAQQAVQNAVRHANAENIQIEMLHRNQELHLRIKDDGDGFDEEQKKNGMGLRIMKHRSDLIGAMFHIESTPQKGTRICCQWNPDTRPEEEPRTEASSKAGPVASTVSAK